MSSVRSRLAASLAAGAVLFAALGTSPASAAPGDAQATGVSADVQVTLLGQSAVDVDGVLGETSAPPSSSVDVVDVPLDALPVAALQADAISLTATSDPSGSSASSEVTGVKLIVPAIDALLGAPILDTGADVISVNVECLTGEEVGS